MGFLNKTPKIFNFLAGLFSLFNEKLYSLLQITTDDILELLEQLLYIFNFDKMIFYNT